MKRASNNYWGFLLSLFCYANVCSWFRLTPNHNQYKPHKSRLYDHYPKRIQKCTAILVWISNKRNIITANSPLYNMYKYICVLLYIVTCVRTSWYTLVLLFSHSKDSISLKQFAFSSVSTSTESIYSGTSERCSFTNLINQQVWIELVGSRVSDNHWIHCTHYFEFWIYIW